MNTIIFEQIFNKCHFLELRTQTFEKIVSIKISNLIGSKDIINSLISFAKDYANKILLHLDDTPLQPMSNNYFSQFLSKDNSHKESNTSLLNTYYFDLINEIPRQHTDFNNLSKSIGKDLLKSYIRLIFKTLILSLKDSIPIESNEIYILNVS